MGVIIEIRFKRDTSFRKQFFVPDSFAHPAKMDAQLLIWIVERYTKEGETILDPMAGSGTMMLACGLSRNVVLVELEEKFCKMMRDNWEEVRMRPQLGYSMGDCQIIQGDARQLEGLVDKIVTSPPYANIGVGQEASKNLIEERIRKGIKGATITEDGRYMTGDGKYLKEYSPSKDNIGNLPYGEIDKIVKEKNLTTVANSSIIDSDDNSKDSEKEGQGNRPLCQRQNGDAPHWQDPQNVHQHSQEDTSRCTDTIKNNIATSPDRLPKEPSATDRPLGGQAIQRGTQGEDKPRSSEGRQPSAMERGLEEVSGGGLANSKTQSSEAGQISMSDMRGSDRRSSPSDSLPNQQGQQPPESIEFVRQMPRQGDSPNPQSNPQTLQISVVVTSPPYEKVVKERGADNYAIIKEKGLDMSRAYSQDEDNIGNLKSQSYLEAMLQVYQQCWSVLKDGGLMILVTKNFIRNKQVIRLDTDTIKLCEQAGFTYLERHYRKLPSQSFWRVIALLKCDHRKGNKQNSKCELGLQCPVKSEEYIPFLLGLEPEKRDKGIEFIEKLCPSFINSSPKLEYEDVLVFSKTLEV